MNVYTILNNWYNYALTQNNINCYHTALYLYIVKLNNTLKWKEEFGLPTDVTMETLKISSYKTYNKYLQELDKLGAIIIRTKSKNQYVSCTISISQSFFDASVININAGQKQVSKQVQNKYTSSSSIEINRNNINTVNTYKKESKDIIFFKEVFSKLFFKNFNLKYIYGNNDINKINSIVSKIKIIKAIGNEDMTDLLLQENIDQFLTKCFHLERKNWYFKNISISVLDSKFNEIINQFNSKVIKDDKGVYVRPKYWKDSSAIN